MKEVIIKLSQYDTDIIAESIMYMRSKEERMRDTFVELGMEVPETTRKYIEDCTRILNAISKAFYS